MSFQPHLVTPMLKRPRTTTASTPALIIPTPTPIKPDHPTFTTAPYNNNTAAAAADAYYKREYEQQVKLTDKLKQQHELDRQAIDQKYADTIVTLTQQHKKLELDLAESRLTGELSVKRLQYEVDRLTTQNVDFQQKIKYLFNKNNKLNDEKTAVVSDGIEQRAQYDTQIAELKQQLRSAQNSANMGSSSVQKPAKTQTHTDSEYNALQQRYDVLQKQISSLNDSVQHYVSENDRLRSRTHELAEVENKYIVLQNQYDELSIQSTNNTIMTDNQQLYKTNSDKYVELQRKFDKLHKQYNVLNDKNMNVLLLNEKLTGLTDKCTQLQQKYDAAQKQLAVAEADQSESVGALKQLFPEASTVEQVVTQVKQLQASNIDLLKQMHTNKLNNGELTSQITFLTDLNNAYKSADGSADQTTMVSKLNALNEQYHVLVAQRDSNSKILHVADNPLMQAITGKYKKQIADLEAKLKQLTDSGATQQTTENDTVMTRNTVDTASADHVTAEFDAYRVDAEKRFSRLRSVFNEKVTNFREFVYLVSGYKIELLDNNIYKMQSMYFDNSNDYLLFQTKLSRANMIDSLELLETNCSKTIDNNVMAYLSKASSVPAFLAALTLDMFDKQTKMIS